MTPLYAIAFDWPDAGTSGWWMEASVWFDTREEAEATAEELRANHPSATYTVVMLAPVAIEPVDTATANAVIMATDTFGRTLGEVPKLVDMKVWLARLASAVLSVDAVTHGPAPTGEGR